MPPPYDIFFDNNVWDFLQARKIDLATEFPRDRYRLWITREAEFEIAAVPDAVRPYVEDAIKRCGVRTDRIFGFGNPSLPIDEQRVGGFGQGRWISPEEMDFIQGERQSTRLRRTKLFKNEADIALAARSMHTVVLTLDKKRGPLKRAANKGGKILFLKGFDASGLSLSAFVQRAYPQNGVAKP
jgi:hypothetical protein